MLHTIHNDVMTVTIDELGAQLMSITAADGTEYLWNGDPAYWTGRAPNLFPYVGRLTNDRYAYGGKEYEMTRHGFAKRTAFSPADQGRANLTLRMTDTPESRESYPFSFRFDVSYVLASASRWRRESASRTTASPSPGPAGPAGCSSATAICSAVTTPSILWRTAPPCPCATACSTAMPSSSKISSAP